MYFFKVCIWSNILRFFLPRISYVFSFERLNINLEITNYIHFSYMNISYIIQIQWWIHQKEEERGRGGPSEISYFMFIDVKKCDPPPRSVLDPQIQHWSAAEKKFFTSTLLLNGGTFLQCFSKQLFFLQPQTRRERSKNTYIVCSFMLFSIEPTMHMFFSYHSFVSIGFKVFICLKENDNDKKKSRILI